MKKLLVLAALATITLASCSKTRLKGSGSTVSDTRYVSSFHTLQADGDVDVDVFPSNENKVVVTGYSNLVPVYETNVSNDKLTLKFRDNYINVRNNNIHITVYTSDVNMVRVNGSGNMTVQDSIRSKTLQAEINGSGNMTIKNNHFESMELKISGSGNINAQQSKGDYVYARISGSGSIDVTVGRYLNAKISGSGDINYRGTLESIDTDISGSGKVRKR